MCKSEKKNREEKSYPNYSFVETRLPLFIIIITLPKKRLVEVESRNGNEPSRFKKRGGRERERERRFVLTTCLKTSFGHEYERLA